MKKNILHLCNYEATENIESNLSFVSEEDAVIFYTINMTKSISEKLTALFKGITIYFIIKNNTDDICSINHEKWLQLVNQYNSTMTWK
jgi:hypothetical protein